VSVASASIPLFSHLKLLSSELECCVPVHSLGFIYRFEQLLVLCIERHAALVELSRVVLTAIRSR